MKKIRNIKQLKTANLIAEEDATVLEQVTETLPVGITPHILSLADTPAIRKQFMPDARELIIQPGERADPIGDFRHSPVKGIVHRHPDRCLLKPINVCAAYCRFCFRRDQLGSPSTKLSSEDLEKALQYIASTPQIWEVILTGGEPLMLKAEQLSAILLKLDAIPHVEIIRIHSRLPVHDPQKITADFVKCLETQKPLYFMLHINHPDELSKDTVQALKYLQEAGIPILSQTVLLKEVNDSVEVLEKLFRLLVQNKVKPYYLHHLDLTPGTSHFRVSVQTGQKLMQVLRARVSGLCMPTYVLDIPGGAGKIPIGLNHFCEQCFAGEETEDSNLVYDAAGRKHRYP